ncbi:hypothetical protein LK09_10445 [Microbacterium mangrovi]|uniref:Uncharacterized protein n=1 Tax=Microbacterium mangrovi TaxID=1348253 RepID=A0A0B2A797_9MICO|nr:hypothetical protein [Microbacterium mangrovi]KHK97623.1 hypothetical protein LK09_10445 [Microbacterium mangrovi]
MTDDPTTTDAAAKTPANIPLAILVCAGMLCLVVSGILWGSASHVFDGFSDPLRWELLDPTTAAWIVVLFWVGILCLIGALVASAVGFSVDRALAAHAATPRRAPAPGRTPSDDAARSPSE